MPITTLNKVIILFFEGGLTTLLLVSGAWRLGLLDAWLSHWADTPWAFLSLIMLPIIVLLGIVAEGLADWLVLDRLDRASRVHADATRSDTDRAVDRWLANTNASESARLWWLKFHEAVTSRHLLPDTIDLDKIQHSHSRLSGGLAVGLMFHGSNARVVDWGVQHHAMFMMAGTFAVLVLGSSIVFGVVDIAWEIATYGYAVWRGGLIVVLGGVAAWICLHFSMEKWHYAHEVAYREGYITLTDPAAGKSAPPDSAGGPS